MMKRAKTSKLGSKVFTSKATISPSPKFQQGKCKTQDNEYVQKSKLQGIHKVSNKKFAPQITTTRQSPKVQPLSPTRVPHTFAFSKLSGDDNDDYCSPKPAPIDTNMLGNPLLDSKTLITIRSRRSGQEISPQFDFRLLGA